MCLRIFSILLLPCWFFQSPIQLGRGRRKIKLKESNAKCRYLKKFTGLCGRYVHLSEAQNSIPPPTHTVNVYTVYLVAQGGGGEGVARVEPKRR